MEQYKIPTTGKVDRPRNVRRLTLECVPRSAPGASIEGAFVRYNRRDPQQPTRVEIYLDRAGVVADKVFDADASAALDLATERANEEIADWMARNGSRYRDIPEPERSRRIRYDHQIDPYQRRFLTGRYRRTGIPSIARCDVIREVAGSEERIGIDAFLKLPHDRQLEWTHDPPFLPEVASAQSTDRLSASLAEALGNLAGGSAAARIAELEAKIAELTAAVESGSGGRRNRG